MSLGRLLAVTGRDVVKEDLEANEGILELGKVLDDVPCGIVGVRPRVAESDELERMRP